jgi:hypothetical protein
MAKSQALLDCAEPTLSDWEEYSSARNDLFNRLAALPSLCADGDDAGDVQDLVAQTFEKDRLLLQRIENQLSSLREQIATAAENSRASEIYSSYATGPRGFTRGRF